MYVKYCRFGLRAAGGRLVGTFSTMEMDEKCALKYSAATHHMQHLIRMIVYARIMRSTLDKERMQSTTKVDAQRELGKRSNFRAACNSSE